MKNYLHLFLNVWDFKEDMKLWHQKPVTSLTCWPTARPRPNYNSYDLGIIGPSCCWSQINLR